MDQPTSFLDQFRDDPIVLLGPILATAPFLLLVLLAIVGG